MENKYLTIVYIGTESELRKKSIEAGYDRSIIEIRSGNLVEQRDDLFKWKRYVLTFFNEWLVPFLKTE